MPLDMDAICSTPERYLPRAWRTMELGEPKDLKISELVHLHERIYDAQMGDDPFVFLRSDEAEASPPNNLSTPTTPTIRRIATLVSPARMSRVATPHLTTPLRTPRHLFGGTPGAPSLPTILEDVPAEVVDNEPTPPVSPPVASTIVELPAISGPPPSTSNTAQPSEAEINDMDTAANPEGEDGAGVDPAEDTVGQQDASVDAVGSAARADSAAEDFAGEVAGVDSTLEEEEPQPVVATRKRKPAGGSSGRAAKKPRTEAQPASTRCVCAKLLFDLMETDSPLGSVIKLRVLHQPPELGR